MFRFTAFCYNLFVPPVLKDGIAKHGIQTFYKLYNGDIPMSFEQLQQKLYIFSLSSYKLDIIFSLSKAAV